MVSDVLFWVASSADAPWAVNPPVASEFRVSLGQTVN